MGDDDDNNNNSDDNCIACDDQINAPPHGPCAPWGQTGTTAALACRGFDVVVIAKQSGTVRECTDAPAYASSSSGEDGGMTAPMASSLVAATAALMARSTTVARAPPPTTATPTTTTPPMMMMPSATPMTSFVKLNFI